MKPTSSAAKKHGVVFVDVSYRLGALGFLSLKSLALESYPQYSGNYGLGDVVTALEWIQLNIQHFGGHPHKVLNIARKSIRSSPSSLNMFYQLFFNSLAVILPPR